MYDMHYSEDLDRLPGEKVRVEGEPEVKDADVNKAYDNVGHVLEFYKEYFHWKSIDGKNKQVVSTVHFGDHYENACKYSSPRDPLRRKLMRRKMSSLVPGGAANGVWGW